MCVSCVRLRRLVSAGEVDKDVFEACAPFRDIDDVPIFRSGEFEDLRERVLFRVGFELERGAVFATGGGDVPNAVY